MSVQCFCGSWDHEPFQHPEDTNGLAALLENRQMPDNSRPDVTLGELRSLRSADAATIATLRAALDGLVVAAEVACECYEGFRSDGTLAPLLTGTQMAALRAALAAAKETL